MSLVAVVVGVGVLGIAVEAAVEDVGRGEHTVPDVRYESHTQFCPPPVAGGSGTLWAATTTEGADVRFEPQEDDARALPAEALVTKPAFPGEPVDVVGYGAPLAASVTQSIGEPSAGVGAAACSLTASDHWYFAQGSSQNDIIERLVLYNPFPAEAVVRVTTFRENQSDAIALLSDVSVPADSHTVVDFQESIKPLAGQVGVEVVAKRGRVVAWRSMLVLAEDRPPGLELTLGATAPATTVYFPDGAGTVERSTSIVIMNPTEDEASVRLSLLTTKRPIEPPGLGEIAIPPMTARAIGLRAALEGQDPPDSFGIVVGSNRPIVAERTISSTGEQSGRASEVGTDITAGTWSLLPVAPRTSNDRLTILNPGDEAVDVTVTLAPIEGQASTPEALNVTVRGHRRAELLLDQFAERAPFVALVKASGPVVAERSGYAAARADLVSAIGVPVDAEEEP
jgi:hypothetical protein